MLRSSLGPAAAACAAVLWAAASAVPARGDEAPETLRVMTWNVEWFFDDFRGDNRSDIAREQSPPDRAAWEWKRDAVAASIAAIEPTIIALQEVEDRNAMFALRDTLREQHQLSYRVAFIDGFDLGTEQDVAILFRSGLVEFSRREQSSEMFASAEFYNLSKHLFGRFEWQTADGRTESLLLLTVHLRARAEAADLRRRQAKLGHRWLAAAVAARENVILLGDMNVESSYGQPSADDDGIELLAGKGTPSPEDDLRDLHEFLPADRRRTHMILPRQFDRVLVSPPLLEDAPGRVDLVFKSVRVATEATVRGTPAGPEHWEDRYDGDLAQRDVSDHYPVVVDFDFR